MTERFCMAREDAETLALRALAYIVGDGDLGPRFLDLTGLDVAGLRARAGEPGLLAAALGFLEAHEPSLVAAAAGLAVKPTALIDAHRQLA
ncbi:MAG: DUF3572 family protein [Janthinobacterium lividum]